VRVLDEGKGKIVPLGPQERVTASLFPHFCGSLASAAEADCQVGYQESMRQIQ
jgi:hypothetical protein